MRPLSGMSPLSYEITKWKISGEHNIYGVEPTRREFRMQLQEPPRSSPIAYRKVVRSSKLAGLIVEWKFTNRFLFYVLKCLIYKAVVNTRLREDVPSIGEWSPQRSGSRYEENNFCLTVSSANSFFYSKGGENFLLFLQRLNLLTITLFLVTRQMQRGKNLQYPL